MNVFAALVFLGVASVAGANPWQRLPSLPQPNAGFACGLDDGRIVVIGGTRWEGGRKQWLATVCEFDPRTLRWESLPSLEQPLAYALAGTTDGRLIAAGGSTGRAPFPGRIEIAHARVHERSTGGIDLPAVTCAGGLMGDDFVWTGGTDDAANVQGFRRSTFAWNVGTGQRRRLPDYPGPAFGGADAAIAGDELLIFGGCVWDVATQSLVNFPEAYAFSPGRNAWRRLRPLPYPVRGIASAPLDARHLYLAGGYKNDAEKFVDRAFIYDLREDRYRTAMPLPYPGGVSLLVAGGWLYCLGGEDGMKHRSAAVYRIALPDLLR